MLFKEVTNMTALETMTALRICGNHPSMREKKCTDCPYQKACEAESVADAGLFLIAADVIEELMKELAAARAGIEVNG